MESSMLSLLTFFPTLGALLLLGFPKNRDSWIRWAALAFSLITFLLSLVLLADFVKASLSQHQEVRPLFFRQRNRPSAVRSNYIPDPVSQLIFCTRFVVSK